MLVLCETAAVFLSTRGPQKRAPWCWVEISLAPMVISNRRFLKIHFASKVQCLLALCVLPFSGNPEYFHLMYIPRRCIRRISHAIRHCSPVQCKLSFALL